VNGRTDRGNKRCRCDKDDPAHPVTTGSSPEN
jgi:hypothetical protein